MSKINTSGVNPLDQRVLVLPDAVEEKTKGGIFLPETHKEQQKFATMKGVLIAVGLNAWQEARMAIGFAAPIVGSRVLIAKYGGVEIEGADGKEYRILNDEDIIGVLEE